MKVEDGKLVECTRLELYDRWLKRWSDIYSFTEYKDLIKAAGVEVKDERILQKDR